MRKISKSEQKMKTETSPSPGIAAVFADVVAFNEACGVPRVKALGFPPIGDLALAVDLIVEEVDELTLAVGAKDMPGTADAIGDLIYVALGLAYRCRIPMPAVWDAIHRANMAKVDPATGKVKLRKDGKILKPDGWQPPDIAAALGLAPAEAANGGA